MNQTAGGDGSAALASLGLSEAELAVYEELIDRASATASDLVGTGPGGARHFGRILSGLEAKGLVTRGGGRPVNYAAVPPEVGLDLFLAQREDDLRRAKLATLRLTERFHQERAKHDVSGLIEIVAGARAVTERHMALHRTAREQLRLMARPPFVVSEQENRAITVEAHENDVRVRNIIDSRYFEDEEGESNLTLVREDIAAGEAYRVMGEVPLKLVVADDRVALIPLEVRPGGIESAVLLHSSALLEALIEVFETFWSLAFPLDLLGVDEGADWETASVTPDERELLVLLAAGVSDDVIARRLKVSHSTVQRRVHALKTRLGAATRFQAGLQAALRGWITDSPSSDGPSAASSDGKNKDS